MNNYKTDFAVVTGKIVWMGNGQSKANHIIRDLVRVKPEGGGTEIVLEDFMASTLLDSHLVQYSKIGETVKIYYWKKNPRHLCSQVLAICVKDQVISDAESYDQRLAISQKRVKYGKILALGCLAVAVILPFIDGLLIILSVSTLAFGFQQTYKFAGSDYKIIKGLPTTSEINSFLKSV